MKRVTTNAAAATASAATAALIFPFLLLGKSLAFVGAGVDGYRAFALAGSTMQRHRCARNCITVLYHQRDDWQKDDCEGPSDTSRRALWRRAGGAAAGLLLPPSLTAYAAVGTLPELASTNAVLQGITVQVADKSQQDAMIGFLVEGFDCQVLRKRIRDEGIEETWLGYGPEQLDVPQDFVLPVSSFARYGGHASVRVVYDSATKEPLYRVGADLPPGNNVAYLQISVPNYRISKILSNGGVIQDAYGLVSVVSPSGLPVRGVVGLWPDPLMLVAINCRSVPASASFYRQLGFAEAPVPYSRPSMGTTVFEPSPPPGAVYMSPCATGGMGVLLLPTAKKNAAITPNRAVQSLNLVYTPSSTPGDASASEAGGRGGTGAPAPPATAVDPSGVSISFQPVSDFQEEERVTR